MLRLPARLVDRGECRIGRHATLQRRESRCGQRGGLRKRISAREVLRSTKTTAQGAQLPDMPH